MTHMECYNVFLNENISGLSNVLQERITNAAFKSFEDLVMVSVTFVHDLEEIIQAVKLYT